MIVKSFDDVMVELRKLQARVNAIDSKQEPQPQINPDQLRTELTSIKQQLAVLNAYVARIPFKQTDTGVVFTEQPQAFNDLTVREDLTVLGTIISRNIRPFVDNTYNIGTSILRYAKGFFFNLRLDGLTANRRLRLDANKDIIADLVNLADNTNEITGTLPLTNGGTGSTTANGARTAICQGFSAVVPLGPLTGGGTSGSITFTDGVATAHTDPT